MKPFIDDEIKQLKADTSNNRTYLVFERMQALLGRLKAAEKALEEARFLEGYEGKTEYREYQTWRKVAGK